MIEIIYFGKSPKQSHQNGLFSLGIALANRGHVTGFLIVCLVELVLGDVAPEMVVQGPQTRGRLFLVLPRLHQLLKHQLSDDPWIYFLLLRRLL